MTDRMVSGTVRVVAFSAAMLLLTLLVVTRSQAAFTATTSNPTSGFTAGKLALSDNDANTALFTTAGMIPGSPVVKCITVTYSGDLTPAPVRLYGTSSGSLAPYLDLTIESGTGGSGADCAGFASPTPLYSGTVSAFSSAHSAWGNGATAFTAAGTPASRTFRFTVSVQDNDAAQSLSANASFTWETQTA